MIVREEDEAFIMIQQHDHAAISAEVMQQFSSVFLKEDQLAETVLFAIRQHDCGWRKFDAQPFWNDEKQAPYTFTDFPGIPKTVLYTQGIDEVEKQNPYAALLCSAHYTKFVKRQSDQAGDEFLAQERRRREQIRESLPFYDPERFAKHLGLLQLADNLSLYVCLNEPGTKKSEVHPFFKEGIPVAAGISEVEVEKLEMNWVDEKTVHIKGLPAVADFSVMLEQRRVEKTAIASDGLVAAYERAPITEQHIYFQV